MSDLNASAWAPQARWTHRGGHLRTPNRRAFINPLPVESQVQSVTVPDQLNNERFQNTSASKTGPDSLERYDRLLRRLHWKGQLLFYAHQVASDYADQEAVLAQFKLDFFEFYSLLERTLVQLLAAFRIQIARIGPATDRSSSPSKLATSGGRGTTNGVTQNTAEDDEPKLSLIGSRAGPSKHRFHLNVLQALDQPGPLHEVLGRGKVREYLDFAKDLRNRWKDVGDGYDAPQGIPQLDGNGGADVSKQVPSRDELQQLLEKIFEGLHAARPLIEREVEASRNRTQQGGADSSGIRSVESNDDMAMELDHDAPYEVMIDDMEIE